MVVKMNLLRTSTPCNYKQHAYYIDTNWTTIIQLAVARPTRAWQQLLID